MASAVVAPAAGATTYFVDPGTGNDANAGTTPAAPWRTPPGTRTATDSGFLRATWGSISTTNKVRCGDTILLKGGSSQTSAQGGAWRIDNGPNAGDTPGYYSVNCTASSPIAIRVASSAEWPGSSGPFTLDGSGTTSACLRFCGAGGRSALLHVQDVNGLVLGGISASQRLVVRAAQPGLSGTGGNGLMVTRSSGGNCPACGGQLSGIKLEWLELASNNFKGLETTELRDSVFRHIVAHDNGASGIGTGGQNDYRQTQVGFEDVETYANGQAAPGGSSDEFLFLGCESCWCVRCRAHNGRQRGLNFGEVGGNFDMRLTIRDSEFHDNGQTTDPNIYKAGPCWSGDDAKGGLVQRGFLERSIVARNRQAGGPCAYGVGWAEVWNSVFYNNGYDASASGSADLAVAKDNEYFGVFNSIFQRTTNRTWTNDAPLGPAPQDRCPVSNGNLYRPTAANSEVLASFNCASNAFTTGNRTYATPPTFLGAKDKLGSSLIIGFVRLDPNVYANNDFHISSGSSAIDAGLFMMRATASGNNATVVSVAGNGASNDPRHYFIAPTSYLEAPADLIQIEGCGVVQVTAMTATSISFTPACSWANGAGIHLPWAGVGPDAGVFELGLSTIASPQLLDVQPIVP